MTRSSAMFLLGVAAALFLALAISFVISTNRSLPLAAMMTVFAVGTVLLAWRTEVEWSTATPPKRERVIPLRPMDQLVIYAPKAITDYMAKQISETLANQVKPGGKAIVLPDGLTFDVIAHDGAAVVLQWGNLSDSEVLVIAPMMGNYSQDEITAFCAGFRRCSKAARAAIGVTA